MKKGRGIGKSIGLAMVMIVMLISITGCMSMASSLARSMIKDYGVYDKSVPESQLVDFIFIGVNIKSFNGNGVNWGSKANNMGRIKLPSGTHNFIYDWIQEETRQTGSSYNSYTGTTTLRYTTTTRSLRDLNISQIEFLPGHRYQLSGAWINGEAYIYMQDTPNYRADMYGDKIAKAPKESKTPTNFEGNWSGADGTTFKFVGNTWELMNPPRVSINYSDNKIQMRGTFEVDGNNIILYQTHFSNDGGRWINIGGLKTAYIWTYSFNGNNLEMEFEYLTPMVVYTKQ
jgi:hypothetical protein